MVVNRICRGELDPEELIQTLQRQPDNYGKLTL